MYAPRHPSSANIPQSGPPPQPPYLGPTSIINESCDKIKKEFEQLQNINQRLNLDLEQIRNEKHDIDKRAHLCYEMSYGFHFEMCKEREISKRLQNIIMSIIPYLNGEQQISLTNSIERAKQISSEEVNNILAEQMRETWGNGMHADALMPGSMASLQHRRPLSGAPGGLPGLPHGLSHLGPPMHLPHNLPPNSLPPHGPPMHGMPPVPLMPPGLNLSSPPNPGLLSMSGVQPPNLGMLGGPGSVPLPQPPMRNDNQLPSSRNSISLDANTSSNNINNNSINNSFNHGKPPRGSIDSERRAPSSSSATSESNNREMHNTSQSNDYKHQNSNKRHKQNDNTFNQHQVMLNHTSSMSDDEKSEDLVVDGNDDRPGSPNSHFNGSSGSPRENGGPTDWNPSKTIKKERPLSRASSANSGPSMKERSSPSQKTGSSKQKLSPNQLNMGPIPESQGPPTTNPLIPGIPNFGRNNMYMNPLGPDMTVRQHGPAGFPMPPFPHMNEICSIQLDADGRQRYIPCSPQSLADPLVPKRAREVFTLQHGEVVCAVALSNPTKNIYTGGKGFVKVWSLDNSENNNEIRQAKVLRTPITMIPCLQEEHYVRSCKLLPDGKKLIVGGEVPPISVWDLAGGGSPKKIGELEELAQACYALAISPDNKICITCCSDGTIGLYDIHNLKLIGKFQGHNDGASCIDISSDGNTLWTGGLDTTLKSWDLSPARSQTAMDYVTRSSTEFHSQIFSLGCCPKGDSIAVGMENSIIEVMSLSKPERLQLKMHESCVLALKFAASGKWFISTGKDKLVNLCGSPAINCPLIMKVSKIYFFLSQRLQV